MAKILIVEDNTDTNEALSEYLQEAGHEIISAYDGTEALKFFSHNKIDLMVLDIMLPKMSGLAVLSDVRKTSRIPVIMLTAVEDEYTQVSSFDCLADDYMTKPFSMVVLGKRITALLRRAGGKDEPDIWKYGDLTVDFSGYSACDQNGKIDVTPKELDLLESKTYVMFIASIVRNYLFQGLKKVSKTENNKKNYTVPAAVSELEKIILVKNSKDIYIRRYGLTKRQRKILGQFGVTESYLNKVADKVNTLV